ncbi:uncharacterized protein A4U43_C03F26020 [Asparagus officinalis]|uniref:Cystatin domain-containing protein n=1 Tax=Asparagus officinalis TaxID=4686 RepID=A0A5P1FCZ9_ASPOF|nr:cysteine proteinase inhibitor 5-like [Asparagus officinalis]ONK76286.1 uncharacterized protein A4U43_C03F26020 [Asparagus officinalis]
MRANYSFVLVFLLASVFVLARLPSASSRLGGWTPIKNMGDPHVTEIVEFAVREHNEEANGKLRLGRAIKGETQVVGGVKYKLFIEARDYGGKTGSYEVVVLERAWEKFMKLVSFKPVVKV